MQGRTETDRLFSEFSPDQLVTVRQTTELLHVDRATVYKWLADGRLPGYRLGGRAVRIRVADLEALVAPLDGGRA